MAIFDSGLPGTGAEIWAADERLAALPRLELTGISEVIVIAAHPDDETLGAGGLMAQAAAAGIAVKVIVVTDGGASHPNSSSISPVHLAVLRRLEVANATELLAPKADLVFLDFEDGSIFESRDQVLTEICAVVDRAPDTALLVVPWRGDGHRDHSVLGEICRQAVEGSGKRLWEYPIWMWHWATPDHDLTPWDSLTALVLDDHTAALKHEAIRLHHSQVAPLSADAGDEVVLNDTFLRNFDLGVEVFIASAVSEPTAALLAEAATPGNRPGNEFFDSTDAIQTDPWSFMTHWYELRKREITLSALPREHYRNAFEIGSSIGMLTEELAGRADRLLAVDVSIEAVQRARVRCALLPQVKIEQLNLAEAYPEGSFDLVILSEVGYQFSADDLDGLLRRIEHSLTPDGALVLCHWRHPIAGYPLTGAEVHAAAESLRLTRVVHHVEKDFLLTIYTADGMSVAEQTELI